MNALAERDELAPGRRLGRYEICAKLAAGGMATVYLARATGPAGFDKLVALKVVHPRLARQSGFIEMFLDEARIASRITHANVGSVFDVGDEGGTFFLAMDYLHGESLASVLGCVARTPEARASHLYPVLVTAIIAAACEGLHVAHELRGDDGQPLNVVHRDVSPHNIFVTYDGGVRVVDFGIARAAGRLHKTMSGTIKGKVAYMPPEQLRGDELDRRADIWAIGVTLWELLTCRRLFRRQSEGKTIDAVLTSFVPAPSTFAPHLPPGTDDILASTLSRDPSGRPPTARELGKSLRRAIAATGEVVGMAELAEWMEGLFAEHRAEKQSMIDAARRGGAIRRVPDTQRFARIPADLVPTASEERSDVREKAREGMDTLRDGGMGAVQSGAASPLASAANAAPPAEPAPSAAGEGGTPDGAAARSTADGAARAPRSQPGAPSAPSALLSSERAPVHRTESVVLPRSRLPAAALALGGLLLVAGLAVGVVLLARGGPASTDATDATETDAAPGAATAPAGSSAPAPASTSAPSPASTAASTTPRAVEPPPGEAPAGPSASSLEPTGPSDAISPSPSPSPDERERSERVARSSPPSNGADDRAAAPQPAPAATAPGRLSLGVRGGWGTFVVDGNRRGDTPRELTLPAGRHRVVIRPFGEGPPIRRTVVVRPGETTRVTVDAP